MRVKLSHIILLFIAAVSISCSTTKVLSGNQRRLSKNTIKVEGDKEFNPSDLTPYLKQVAKGWTPFMVVYNWENGKGKGWDNFVHKLGTEPTIFEPSLVNSSVQNIKDHLGYLGYYGSEVETEQVDRGNKKVEVRYNVKLGRRYPIRKITFEVPSYGDFAKDYFADTSNFTIHAGDFLSEEALEQETIRSERVMRNKGYYDFNKNYFFFEADTVTYPNEARLHVIIKNHTRNEKQESDIIQKKYTIGKVSVNYPENLKLRKKVLMDLNTMRSGSLYSETAASTVYSRFNSVPVFNSVNIQMNPTDSQTVNCDINLQKSRIQGFKVGLEASVNTSALFGISPEISYYHRNIFNGGEVLNVTLSTNHQMRFDNSNVKSNEVQATASLTFPRFLPLPTKYFRGPNLPKTEFKLSYSYQSRPEYLRHRFQTSWGYLGNYTRNFTYQVNPISLTIRKLSNMDLAFLESISKNSYLWNSFTDYFDLGLNSTLYYNSSGMLNPRTSYWYGRFIFDLSGNLLSAFDKFLPQSPYDNTHLVWDTPYSQYVRGELSLGKTFAWDNDWWHALAFRFLAGAGYAYGNSTVLPYEKAFYSGGANSLRGWSARTVGPGCAPLDDFWSIPNQTGDFKLEANIEYRFKMFWKIEGAVFADAGNVWLLGNPFDPAMYPRYLRTCNFAESIAADWGLGLRVNLSFLVLRIDWGHRLHDPARTEKPKWVIPFKEARGNYAFHFGIGYPF